MKRNVLMTLVLTCAFTGIMSVSAFAASEPADDVTTYSYNTGMSDYDERMSEDHPWFDNACESETSGYSFNSESANALARINAFANLPTETELTDEELAAFFEKYGIGEGSAWADGEYDESLKSSYGYTVGQAAYLERHTSFTEE